MNAGVHADVSPEEARFLFLDTYLLLGEILSLAVVEAAEVPGPMEEQAGIIGPTEPPAPPDAGHSEAP